MIISEKQIMLLTTHCKDYMAILVQSHHEFAAERYNKLRDLFDEIANQQSEELKAIE